MESTVTAVEMTGTVDENRQLKLDGALPFSGPRRVRVIVLSQLDDEKDEISRLQAAARNPVFEFLDDPAEDIYSLNDGIPFGDEV